jgi:ferric-dicitrate binding protein FerR (iron transport regulator)
VPAKSKHMEQRKQRIANAKKNARLAGRLRRRRRLQALGGLLAISAVLALAYLWQSGFFADEEPAAEETPTSEVTEAPTVESTESAPPESTETPTAESGESPSETETE